ncbi:MAG: radical SAM protein [Clostridia bacterium]|nr:radical SAM protein [Clostridia bacterium]
METKVENKPSSFCTLCPRMCGVNRSTSRGYCGAGDMIEVSKIMLHRWEEPPISGSDPVRGSGAVFFTHCPLGCVYCQNRKISSRTSHGVAYTVDELADAMLKLEADGAYNINFVSPTQYTKQIKEAVLIARDRGLTVPIVWNTGGYETPETIALLRGTVDIFLTDFKYASDELAEKYSRAKDYPLYAADALREMYASTGAKAIGEDGMMKRGIIVRHLVLPSHREDSENVLGTLASIVPPRDVFLSLMAQYTPEFLPAPNECDIYRSIRRRVTSFEYEKVVSAALRLGFDGFIQGRESATSVYTPDF